MAVYRRAALVGVGGAAGCFALKKHESQCHAMSWCGVCAAVTTGVAVSVGGLAAYVLSQEERITEEMIREGIRLLQVQASKGDQAALFCVAGMMHSTEPAAAEPVFKLCQEDHPDCKAFYALAYEKGPSRDEDLIEAGAQLKSDMTLLRSEHRQIITTLPPPPPGMYPALPEHQATACKAAGAAVAQYVLLKNAASALQRPPGLSPPAQSALEYVAAVRGCVPFYYNVAMRALDRGEKKAAAEDLACFLASPPEQNGNWQYFVNCLSQGPVAGPQESTLDWKRKKVVWWILAVASGTVELSKLYKDHQPGNEAFLSVAHGSHDAVARSLFMQAVETLPVVKEKLQETFPEEPVLGRAEETFEHCRKALQDNGFDDQHFTACSEGLRYLAQLAEKSPYSAQLTADLPHAATA
ncbi:hypothetical protein DIPPA_27632 [Diplonema papillatum]|nr:hypothetical protein DIPPA_27632 [Diplonema papillatum]